MSRKGSSMTALVVLRVLALVTERILRREHCVIGRTLKLVCVSVYSELGTNVYL